jgi:hypothetical protein
MATARIDDNPNPSTNRQKNETLSDALLNQLNNEAITSITRDESSDPPAWVVTY